MKHTMPKSDMDNLLSDSFVAIMALKGICRDIDRKIKIGELDQEVSLLSVVARTWEDQIAERQQWVGKIPYPLKKWYRDYGGDYGDTLLNPQIVRTAEVPGTQYPIDRRVAGEFLGEFWGRNTQWHRT